MDKKILLKHAAAALCGLYSIAYAFTGNEWHFIDSVDLIIHEAGHVIFYPFGYFMYVLGGSLFQILVPTIFAVYFWYKDEKFSAGLLFSWVAINLFNVSVYAGDAIRMQLPLITGDTDGHDWNQLLLMSFGLKATKTISTSLWLAGMAVSISGTYISFKNAKNVNLINNS